ncbi:hypothetical protein [Halosolutus halophilus]|uniref:hypothetical protein n=1 Tax=Halosolutus halophilus TaxID=1552990 RepID=UPI0022351E32|nr:hypothetical protein [Halosolutus halophilus]
MNGISLRRLSIAMVFLAGVLAGAVILAGSSGLAERPGESAPDPENPPTSISSAGPSCYNGSATPNAGWVHEVAAGRSYAVTLNATVVHDAGTEVTAEVIPRANGEYELAFRTVEHTAEKSLDCERFRTRFEMGVSLPIDYERVVVTVNDRVLVDATRDDTTADLYPLPSPVNATS